MSDPAPISRCPDLMSRDDTALMVIDVQGKLARLVSEHQRVIWNCTRLVDAAKLLHIHITGTEQYPQGLGTTVDELASRLGELPSKTMFSCRGAEGLFSSLEEHGIRSVLLAGIEAHVCVQQTAFDLLSEGFAVYLAVDAIGARHEVDREYALRRMESAGVTLTTTESAIFEWCEDAMDPAFKAVSQIVQQNPPE